MRSLDLSPLTRMHTGAENPDVVDFTRLKVVFCRFRLAPSVMVLRPGPQPYGETRPKIGANSVGGEYLFNGTFILINLNKQERITLAHEIVHAAGRWHIPDVVRRKRLMAYLRDILSNPATRRYGLAPGYERLPGALYDGPEDDIVNAHSIGKEPHEVKLYPEDQARLAEEAFFVPKV